MPNVSPTDKLPVFFCTDNNYTVPTYIAIYSLLHNYRGAQAIEVFILTTKVFSDENTKLLKSLSAKFPNVEIKAVAMDSQYDSVAIVNPRISTPTMYRLLIPRFVKDVYGSEMARCLYLDSDIVVEGDVSEFFNSDVEGFCIGAVRDRTINPYNHAPYAKTLGIPSLNEYVNAGVLLMNLREIDAQGLSAQLESAGYRKDFYYNDQDAINSVFYGRTKLLPLRFNTFNQYIHSEDRGNVLIYGEANIQEARSSPIVIHYIGKKKPWSYRQTPLGKLWWKYVDMQDEAVIREYIQPFLKNNRVPPRAAVIEAINQLTKRLGVYPFARKFYYSVILRRKP